MLFSDLVKKVTLWDRETDPETPDPPTSSKSTKLTAQQKSQLSQLVDDQPIPAVPKQPLPLTHQDVHLETWPHEFLESFTDDSQKLEYFLIDATAYYLIHHPEQITHQGLFYPQQYHASDSRFHDWRSEKEYQYGERLQWYYRQIKSCQLEDFSELIYQKAILNRIGQAVIHHRKNYHLYHNFFCSQTNPLRQALQAMADQEISEIRHLTHYTDRLQGFRILVNQWMKRIQFQMMAGQTPSRSTAMKMKQWIEWLITPEDQMDQNIFLQLFDQKTTELDTESRIFYRLTIVTIYRNQLHPLLMEIFHLMTDFLAVSPPEQEREEKPGLAHLYLMENHVPLGAELYRWRLLSLTGLNLDPADLWTRLQDQLASWQKRWSKDTVPTTPGSPPQAIQPLLEQAVARLQIQQPLWIPPSEWRVEPSLLRTNLGLQYRPSSFQGTGIGLLQAPPTMTLPPEQALWEATTHLFGTHVFRSSAQHNTTLPLFLRVGGIYGEDEAMVLGWRVWLEAQLWNHPALSPVEQLWGNYRHLLRLQRAFVDLALHHLGWSRTQTQEEIQKLALLGFVSLPISESVDSMMETVLERPGQGLLEWVSWMKIQEIWENWQEDSQDLWGPEETQTYFQEDLLSYGALPLTLVPQMMEEKLSQRKKQQQPETGPDLDELASLTQEIAQLS